MNKTPIILVMTCLLGSCSVLTIPQTPAAKESGYTYIPIDPFPIRTNAGADCPPQSWNNSAEREAFLKRLKYKPLLESLPDNAVRMSIEKFDSKGNVTYGPAGFGATGDSYRVTVDYVSSDTVNFVIYIAKTARLIAGNGLDYIDLLNPIDETIHKKDSVNFIVTSSSRDNGGYEIKDIEKYTQYNIPVYVGVGLRVTANVDVVGVTANISGLGVIGAEAESNSLKGSLIVQTLGINGKSIAAALPIQSELNRTTAQNAIVSVGAIKALLYDKNTTTVPRIVGIYLPFPGGKALVNAIISELSMGDNVYWNRPCIAPNPETLESNSRPSAAD